MNRVTKLTVFAAVLLVPLSAGLAITIDGKLADWGVHPGPFGSSDWTPNAGIHWTVEDQNTYYLGPGFGGQKFDAEAFYTTSDSNYLYMALVTGHPPWGAKGWLPGDVAISFLEHSGSNQFGLRMLSGGGLYKGRVYKTEPKHWGTGLWGSASDPTRMKGHPLKVGKASFVYKAQSPFHSNGKHYIMEAKIPISIFGSFWGGDYRLHWTQTCGNDAINVIGSVSGPPPPGVIPEPSTFLLLGLGLLGLGTSYRRKRQKNA